MIRAILAGLGAGFVAVALAWCFLPSAMYVEDALGILMAAFFAAAASGAILWRVHSKRSIRQG